MMNVMLRWSFVYVLWLVVDVYYWICWWSSDVILDSWYVSLLNYLMMMMLLKLLWGSKDRIVNFR